MGKKKEAASESGARTPVRAPSAAPPPAGDSWSAASSGAGRGRGRLREKTPGAQRGGRRLTPGGLGPPVAAFADAPAGDTKKGAKIFKTKCSQVSGPPPRRHRLLGLD